MRRLTRAESLRLGICSVIVIIVMSLSATAFYYFHSKAPLVPLLVGLVAVLPIGLIVDDLRRLLKVKKTQQPHQPPNRS
jgi:hypothetical protein